MIISWLFEIDTYRYSTKAVTFDSVNYTAKVYPDSFNGISMGWDINGGLIFPSDLEFEIDNSDSALARTDLEGEYCTIKLITDGSLTRTHKYEIQTAILSYGKIHVYCSGILQKYLDGDYPNTPHPREQWVSANHQTADGEYDSYRIPVTFGTPYIPLMYIYNTDDSTGYYVLGDDQTYTIEEVKSPPESGNLVWTSADYTFNQTSDSGYKLAEFVIAPTGTPSVYTEGTWASGQKPLVKYSKTSGAVTAPATIMSTILQDFGVPAGDIDTGDTWSDAATTYSTQGITFNGGFYEVESRESILSDLLMQCDSTIYVSDKIELHPFSKTSKETFTTSKVLALSYSPSRIIKSISDSGHVAWAEDGFPQDNLVGKVLVPVDATTAHPDSTTFECRFINDDVVAQKLGILHFQRKLAVKDNISFSTSGAKMTTLTTLKPGDVITVNDTLLGGEQDIIITNLEIQSDLTINITGRSFSILQEFDDLSVSAIPVAEDPTVPTFDLNGEDGADGADGTNGTDGVDGVDGNDGAAGPGLVYRGDFAAGTYYYTDTRRDVVKYGADYLLYNVATDSSGNYEAAYSAGDWEAFSDTFESVATKLLLAEDAAITKSLHVGGGSGDNTAGMSGLGSTSSSVRIWAGSATKTSAPFRVTQAGNLIATNATLSGTMTIGAGSSYSGNQISATYTEADANTINAGDGLAALDSTANSKLGGIEAGAEVTSAAKINTALTSTTLAFGGSGKITFGDSSQYIYGTTTELRMLGGGAHIYVGATAVTVAPKSGTGFSVTGGSNITLTGSGYARLIGDGDCDIEGSAVILTADSGAIQFYHGTTLTGYYASAGFVPNTNNTILCGNSGQAWSAVYTDKIYDTNSAFDDTFDDLYEISQFKPRKQIITDPETGEKSKSGESVINPNTGGEYIDLHDLPRRLTNYDQLLSDLKAGEYGLKFGTQMLMTEEEIIEDLADHDELGWLIHRNVGAFSSLTNGAIRAKMIEDNEIYELLASRITALEKAAKERIK